MADPWTDAWAESEATAPPAAQAYNTLELIHPSLPVPIRAVNGVSSSVMLTLEDDAPVDGGMSVEFKAIPIKVEMPEWEEGKTPESAITIDNVARELTPYLEAAVAVRADLTVIFRQWRVDDVTAPCYGPVTFIMKSVKTMGTQVTGTAKIDDLANRKFPNLFYTLKDFPGLQAT